MVTEAALTPDITNPSCPTRVVLDRIGDRWTVLVVLSLESGPLRFTRLRAEVGGVAPKVLTQTLRGMERDGLLTRTVHPQVPPRVDYELTDLGRSLLRPIHVVTRWAEQHVTEVLDARGSYDRAARDAPAR